MKVAINGCFGGFSLSHEGVMRYAEIKGITLFAFVDEKPLDFKSQRMVEYTGGESFLIHYSTKPLKDGKYQDDSYFSDSEIERNDPALIRVIEELGDRSDGQCASLLRE